MNIYKFPIGFVLVGSILFTGCSRHSDKPAGEDRNRQTTEQPPTPGPAPESHQTPAPQGSGQQAELILPEPGPTTNPQPTVAPVDTNRSEAAKIVDTIRGKVTQVGSHIQGVMANLQGNDAEVEARKESMEEVREQAEANRDRDMAALQQQVEKTAPSSVRDLKEILDPKDQTTYLLSYLMAESDPRKINARTENLIEEIFNEPDLARAKVMEVQLALRKLAASNLYKEDQSKRVAYLQVNLDDKIRTDQSAQILKDALFIAGTSAAVGTVAGYRGFEKIKASIDNYRGIGSSLKGVGSKVRSAFDKTRQGVRSVAAKASEATGLTRAAGVFLPTNKVVERNLRALKIDDEIVKNLDLVPAKSSEVVFSDFDQTNMPGLRYGFVSTWDGVPLNNGEKVLVLSQYRTLRAGQSPSLIVSRPLPPDEVEALIEQLRYKTPQEGGVDFVVMQDRDTSEVISTRMTTDEFREATENVSPPASEPQVEGTGVIPTKAELERFASGLKEKAGQAVQSTKDAVSSAINKVKPAGPFNGKWATTAALGTAIPLTALYYEGYNQGRDYGEGRESLYLESLIPRDRLNEITFSATVMPGDGQ